MSEKNKVIDERVEIAAGVTLMITGWILIFLVVLGVFGFETNQLILLSLLSYAMSIAGLALGSHGFAAFLATRRAKKRLLERKM